MTWIDLRSDTVTHPTPLMRQAMAAAEVGDDVYGEDPTVNRLQEMAAEMVGHAAGLFIPSGTMGNLAAILAHCQRGDEMIVGDVSHTFLHEAGGASALGGIHSRQLRNQPDGTLVLEDIQAAIRSDDDHQPVTRLVILENTHNRCGGVALTVDYTRAAANLAQASGLRLHLDGARLFNASVALGVPAKELASPVDSVTFCLSKGLCAPVGSVLCGDENFIHRARRARKQLGGGMRQAGVLAAAGIVALETMVDRLVLDHQRAQSLAKGLSEFEGLLLDGAPQTNMVFIRLHPSLGASPSQFAEALSQRGVLLGLAGQGRFRMVTHHGIDDGMLDAVMEAFKQVLAVT